MSRKKIICLALSSIIATTIPSVSIREKVEPTEMTINNETFNKALYQVLNDMIYERNQEKIREEQEEYKKHNPEFIKYNLSEDKLKAITRLCVQEQGTPKGVAAEASLMANRFELFGGKFTSLYSYVRNSGWFNRAGYFMDNGRIPNNDYVELVRLVLNEGKRTLPHYIDNHDCMSQVISQSTSTFIRDETVLKNEQGATTIFYDFESETSKDSNYEVTDDEIVEYDYAPSDPFSYSSKELKRQDDEQYPEGYENCYEYKLIKRDYNLKF